jgi:hypothetical protein
MPGLGWRLRNGHIPLKLAYNALDPEKRLMATDSAPKLRVSLWRDFRPGRTLAYQPSGDAGARLFHRHDHLQEEVGLSHARSQQTVIFTNSG